MYHLLFDLSQKIHGRVWPEKDRAAVKRLLSLIRHVCGALLILCLLQYKFLAPHRSRLLLRCACRTSSHMLVSLRHAATRAAALNHHCKP